MFFVFVFPFYVYMCVVYLRVRFMCTYVWSIYVPVCLYGPEVAVRNRLQSTLFFEVGSLSQTQSSPIQLRSLASLLGSPASAFQGWNYGLVGASTGHLHGSWGFELWSFCLFCKHFSH